MKEQGLLVEEIAVHLGVNRDKIFKWVTRNEMPAHKVGRLWRFLASKVDQWVKAELAAPLSPSKPPGPLPKQGRTEPQ